MTTVPMFGRPLDLGRVPPDRFAMLEEDGFLPLHALQATTDVVGIGVARDQLESDLLAAAADEQRQSFLDRRRVVADLFRRIARSGGRRALAVEHPAHDRERLAEPAQALREAASELEPERLVLLLEPGRADAEDRPAVGDVVKGRGHLRGEGRLAERIGPDHQADPDPFSRLRPGRERQPGLEHRSARAALDRVEVIPRP